MRESLGLVFILGNFLFSASNSFAQSPYLRVDPALLNPPPPFGSNSIGRDEITDAGTRYSQFLQERLTLINQVLNAIKESKLNFQYITPPQREAAYEKLIYEVIPAIRSRDTYYLEYCLNNQPEITFDSYQRDLTRCRDQATEAWESPVIQNNPTAKMLLEALVFHSRDELSRLQNFERELNITRLAFDTALRNLTSDMENLEVDLASKDPAFQCNPNLGTLRLDKPSQFQNETLPAPMKDMLIQDQGSLGTCYANAASAAIETMTGQPNSALDLSIRYSMTRVKGQDPISDRFGGDVCGAIEVANQQGVCDRNDSWLESGTPVQSTGKQESYSTIPDSQHPKGQVMADLFQFMRDRSTVAESDWRQLSDHADTLIPRLLAATQNAQAVEAVQSPFAKYLKSMLNSLVFQHRLSSQAASAAMSAITTFDTAHIKELLPSGGPRADGSYYRDPEQAGDQIYRKFANQYFEIIRNQVPILDPNYLREQAQPFLRSAADVLTGTYTINQLKKSYQAQNELNRIIESELRQCVNPEMTQRLIMKVVSIVKSSSKNSGAALLDATALAEKLFSDRTKSPNDAFLFAAAPRCQDSNNRIFLKKPIECVRHYPDKFRSSADWLDRRLILSLTKGQPLSMSYCAEALGSISGPVTQTAGCAGHVSLLTGIRYNPSTNRCDLMVWNSWGLSSGKVWIDEARLKPYIQEIQQVRYKSE